MLGREKLVKLLCNRLNGTNNEGAAVLAIEGFAISSYRSCEDLDGDHLEEAIASHETNLILILTLLANDLARYKHNKK